MRQTQCEFKIQFYDGGLAPYPWALNDSENRASWCEPQWWCTEEYKTRFATFEPDFVRANGGYTWWDPNHPDMVTAMQGIWSKERSDENGVFKNPLKLMIGTPLPAISGYNHHLVFGNCRARKIKLEYFNKTEESQWHRVKVGERIVTTTGVENGDQTVLDLNFSIAYRGIDITFLESEKPFSYIKFFIISMDQYFTIKPSELLSASAFQQMDLLANSLPTGTLQISTVDRDQRFNPLNPDNVYKVFYPGEKLYSDLVINENGVERREPNGRYFLKSFEGYGTASAKIDCVDLIGHLDIWPFNFKKYLKNGQSAPAKDYFNDLMDYSEIVDNVVLDPLLDSMALSGYNNGKTYRDALQKFCVATCTTARTKRDGTLEIYRPFPQLTSKDIGRKYGQEKAKKHARTDGVTVTYYTFTDTAVESTIPVVISGKGHFVKTLTVSLGDIGLSGNIRILDEKVTVSGVPASEVFTDIIIGQTDSNTIFIEAHAMPNDANATVSISIKFTGIKIENHPYEVTVGSANNNVIKDNTLITSASQAKTIAQYWYDYLNTYEMDIDYEAILEPDATVGSLSRIETGLGTPFEHLVTSIQTNLTGGLTAKIKGVGKDVG